MTTALPNSSLIHASCIVHESAGVLLLGASGAGKSDLALRMIHLGAVLVADDQVRLENKSGRLYASAPEKIAGLIELRGVGMATVPFCPKAKVLLAVNLVNRERVERFPENQWESYAGVLLRSIYLHAFDASTPLKIIRTLQQGMSYGEEAYG